MTCRTSKRKSIYNKLLSSSKNVEDDPKRISNIMMVQARSGQKQSRQLKILIKSSKKSTCFQKRKSLCHPANQCLIIATEQGCNSHPSILMSMTSYAERRGRSRHFQLPYIHKRIARSKRKRGKANIRKSMGQHKKLRRRIYRLL